MLLSTCTYSQFQFKTPRGNPTISSRVSLINRRTKHWLTCRHFSPTNPIYFDLSYYTWYHQFAVTSFLLQYPLYLRHILYNKNRHLLKCVWLCEVTEDRFGKGGYYMYNNPPDPFSVWEPGNHHILKSRKKLLGLKTRKL